MRLFKLVSVLVVLGGFAVLAVVIAPALQGQVRRDPQAETRPFSTLLGSTGIGVSIRDVDAAARGNIQGGAVVGDVVPNGPADKAGLKRADIVVEFDGERVRSARQLARLVHESAPGQPVKATLVREGQRKDVQITPVDEPLVDLNNIDERVRQALQRFNFDSGLSAHGRLGVMVQDLPKQLADYFGAKDGLLVSSVSGDSPAARAGLKAGDVITSINGARVSTAQDLTRAVRDADRSSNAAADITIGIVRDKKESTVKVPRSSGTAD